MSRQTQLGARYKDGACHFLVWAPYAHNVELHITSPQEQFIPMNRKPHGYYRAVIKGLQPGSRYYYRLDGRDYPDPASRFQPEGVHGPSQVVDPTFTWNDTHWAGLPLQHYVIYELHIGTFTGPGTFVAAISFLDELKELGITAIELMPVAQFPGDRNWGYDGVYPFAAQNSYGGLEGLKSLVNACHQREMAVILDVVYNHLGPEGNYLGKFAPYFTDRYYTPWGQALNFDGPSSDDVRRYFIENARYWLSDCHIDALRLDALHAIVDSSATLFLVDLSVSVKKLAVQLNRQIYLIGESDANDRRLVLPLEQNGYGIDAQWNEGFHHALHVLLTGENTGYYRDFGRLHHLAKAFREGFVYSGQYSPYRQRRHGSHSCDVPAWRLVVFAQNHDQVGNRMLGERLSNLVPFESLKLAAGVVLLSPFLPLIFMGEEYGEMAPFQYFTSHSDVALIEAVRRGRMEEFKAFRWQGQPPDPQDRATFSRSKINHDLSQHDHHHVLWDFYQELIRLRREVPALSSLSKDNQEVRDYKTSGLLFIRRWIEGNRAITVFNFNDAPSSTVLPITAGRWHKLHDSSEERWLGPGSRLPRELDSAGEVSVTLAPRSLAVFTAPENDM
jgi:maltooligosyltrehalose trehalohydrolase